MRDRRALLAVLVLGTLVYAPIAASDWRAAQETRYVDAMSERSSARLWAMRSIMPCMARRS